MLQAAARWEDIARKWRSLAARRSAHHIEMFNSGRWKHYYSDEGFLLAMRSAIVDARTWGALAPSAAERAAAGQDTAAETAVEQPADDYHLPRAA